MKLNNSFRKKFKILFPVVSIFILTLFFQNCGQDTFQARMPSNIEQASNGQLDLASGNADDNGLAAVDDTSGNNYYVATTGNDSNPGTLAKPCKTIQCAADKANKPGDTINVRKGTYRGNVRLKYSGSPGKPITLRSYPGERAVIDQGPDLAATRKNFLRVVIQNAKGYRVPVGWITIENLDLVRGHEGVKMYNAFDVVIRNCKILNNFNQGILGSGLRVTITGNTIAFNGYMFSTPENLKSNKTHGIYMAGSNHKITNNLIHSNLGYGIQMAGHYYPELHAGPQYGDTKNWLIANNTFAFERNRSGIILWGSGSTNATIINNIFYNNATQIEKTTIQGVALLGSGGGHVINNNLFYSDHGHSAIEVAYQSKYTATKNVTANPLFVNPSKYDFRLSSGSPALKMGAGNR